MPPLHLALPQHVSRLIVHIVSGCLADLCAKWRYKCVSASKERVGAVLQQYLQRFLLAAQLSPVQIHRLMLEGNYVTPTVRTTLCRVFSLTGPQAVAFLIDQQLDIDLNNRIGYSSQAFLKAACADEDRRTYDLTYYDNGNQNSPHSIHSLRNKCAHLMARCKLRFKMLSHERFTDFIARRKPATPTVPSCVLLGGEHWV